MQLWVKNMDITSQDCWEGQMAIKQYDGCSIKGVLFYQQVHGKPEESVHPDKWFRIVREEVAPETIQIAI